MKLTLNEASEFLNQVTQLKTLEIENISSDIPIGEIEQWNNCLQKATNSSEIEKMHDLLNRWKSLKRY